MDNLIQMIGSKAMLVRYLVTYSENDEEREHQLFYESDKDSFCSKLDSIGITYSVDVVNRDSPNEWINGLEFSSYEELVEAINMGEDAYLNRKIESNVLLQQDVMMLDLDFRLSVLELGGF